MKALPAVLCGIIGTKGDDVIDVAKWQTAFQSVCAGTEVEFGECGTLPRCDSCIPVNCVFDLWAEWSSCDCTGLQERHRNVKQANNECGTPCFGNLTETIRCDAPCKKAVDCVLSDWSQWTECQDTVHGGQKYSSRTVVTKALHAGKACDDVTSKTAPCTVPKAKVDCAFSEWSPYTACSKECGLGQQTRHRAVLHDAADGGSPCDGDLVEVLDCNDKACGIATDCVVGQWAAWTGCDSDSPYQKRRERQVQTPPVAGGQCDYDLVQLLACPTIDHPPQECLMSDWGAWSKCSDPCGGGQQKRHRTESRPPSNGGYCPASALREIQPCNTKTCTPAGSLNCQLDEWGPWSTCTATCNAGQQNRTRAVLKEAQPGGEGCNATVSEVTGCKVADCVQTDCLWGNWDEWSACTAGCDGGSKMRNRQIVRSPSEGGKLCEPHSKTEVAPCNTQRCGKSECIDGAWSDWVKEDCPVKCGSGVQKSWRQMAKENNLCGIPAQGDMEKFEPCKDENGLELPPCPGDTDCEFSLWTTWSVCSCECYGVQERSRHISKFPVGDGKPCDGDLNQVQSCNPGVTPSGEWLSDDIPANCDTPDPAVDCVMSDWGMWEQCSKSCGGGQRTRERSIQTPNKNGGKPCPSIAMSEVAPCGTQPCVSKCEDCRWGNWLEWSACSSCGEMKVRNRHIVSHANYCGQPCALNASREVAMCHPECEDQPLLYCTWGLWSIWGTCSGTCGTATQVRDRSLVLQKEKPEEFYFEGFAGSLCSGTETEVQECPNLDECPTNCVERNCEFSLWTDWSDGNCEGLCQRQRVQSQVNNECGKPCSGPLIMTKRCSKVCITDCEWSAWDEWSACADKYQQKIRKRQIETEAKNGGDACDGAAQETKPCSITARPVVKDCVIAEWDEWSTCSVSCGGGTHRRSRYIKSPAENEGDPCAGSLDMIEGCNPGECGLGGTPEQCLLGGWGVWSPCTADAQQNRVREIKKHAVFGGLACNGDLKETRGCDAPVVDCEVSEWTPWQPCDKPCGGGQQRRIRQIDVRPSLGGDECPQTYIETQPCNENPCHPRQDCVLSDWGTWKACSTSCGMGQQVRQRTVTQEASADGEGCVGETEEQQPCTHNPACTPDADCVWEDWSEWSGCTCDCDGGQRTRDRKVLTSPTGNGKLCEPMAKHEIAPCNTAPCGECVSAAWSDWGPFSECSATCSGGMKERSRHVWREANQCGEPVVGLMQEYVLCNEDISCRTPRDCEFGTWVDWSACSCTCDGTKHRTRNIATQGAEDGKFCNGATSETAPCNPAQGEQPPQGCRPEGVVRVDCVLGQWEAWESCSQGCGVGQQSHVRVILTDAAGGGSLCQGPMRETKSCVDAPCPSGPAKVDCRWGVWSDWGGCTKCSGQKSRHRTVAQLAENGGKTCEPGAGRETVGCDKDQIMCHNATWCAWGQWEEWGDCSKTCGEGGERRRARSLQLTTADPVQALYRENLELRHQTDTVENNRMQELVTAFSVGALSLVLVFVILRVGQTATRNTMAARPTQRYSQFPQDEHEGDLQRLEIDGPEGLRG